MLAKRVVCTLIDGLVALSLKVINQRIAMEFTDQEAKNAHHIQCSQGMNTELWHPISS